MAEANEKVRYRNVSKLDQVIYFEGQRIVVLAGDTVLLTPAFAAKHFGIFAPVDPEGKKD